MGQPVCCSSAIRSCHSPTTGSTGRTCWRRIRIRGQDGQQSGQRRQAGSAGELANWQSWGGRGKGRAAICLCLQMAVVRCQGGVTVCCASEKGYCVWERWCLYSIVRWWTDFSPPTSQTDQDASRTPHSLPQRICASSIACTTGKGGNQSTSSASARGNMTSLLMGKGGGGGGERGEREERPTSNSS